MRSIAENKETFTTNVTAVRVFESNFFRCTTHMSLGDKSRRDVADRRFAVRFQCNYHKIFAAILQTGCVLELMRCRRN